MQAQSKFVFQPHEWGLLGNILNEVLHGFDVPFFDSTIGVPREELEKLLRELNTLNDGAELPLSREQTVAFRNALAKTLHELGIEEFQTRTGHDFSEGETMLRKIHDLLTEPGNVG
jgi:hypothetical protein